ncbi:BglG family transcription antiterminator [Proteiniclasticum ruminis]|uniref:BglG family transcription antiterminator n=1 Tax=Proteiniclasticum ruminis TaxID=398199 RepID=UPI000944930C|nr:PTS sugar transporter subunit IIA [Proteiniclasticum ruminis]
MDNKKHNILSHMLTEEGYRTSEELSMLIKVSPRTIMRYIKDINYSIRRFNAEIISSKGIGYLLQVPEKDRKNLKEWVNTISDQHVDDSEEKRNEIIIKALYNHSNNTVEAIGELLCLSIPRVIQLLDSLKKEIKPYDLKIIVDKKRRLVFAGLEKDIRTLILDILLEVSEDRVLSFFENLSASEVVEINGVIQKKLAENNLIISDFDFRLLKLEILIMLSRCKKNKSISPQQQIVTDKIISSIIAEISFVTGIHVNLDEMNYISAEIGGILNSYRLSSDNELSIFVDEMLHQFERITGNRYLEDEHLVNSLKLHLELFLKRSRKGVEISNPIIAQIKKNLPMDFDLAALMGMQIEKRFKVKLCEHEIGFITLHLASFEERRKSREKKRIMIICHYGMGSSQLLKEKIMSRFEDYSVVGVYPVAFLDVALKLEADIIITTVDVEIRTNTPVIFVENIFTNEVFDLLEQNALKQSKIEKISGNLFHPENFNIISASSKEEIINIMGLKLIKNGFTNERVIEEVLDREKMASTDIGNLVAIPHTLSSYQDKSFISVGLLESPVYWTKENVQLVFLVCFNREDRENLDIFKYLYNFIKDEGAVKSMIRFSNFESFMKILKNVQ